jgi:hypothetical protein
MKYIELECTLITNILPLQAEMNSCNRLTHYLHASPLSCFDVCYQFKTLISTSISLRHGGQEHGVRNWRKAVAATMIMMSFLTTEKFFPLLS